MKNNALSLGLRAIAFLLIFVTLFTIATFVFLPKRKYTNETAQPAGFYQEPDNTIDVLFLGSCNMYSSMSPVLMYESHGITGYCFCCPDQEMSTSYYYLKEALKNQDLKAVVLEAFFLTQGNGKKREYYNRFAFDYFPLNANKIELAWKTSQRESVHMAKYDSTAPDALLTFAGYIFPLLRYHGRTDLSWNDVTFFLKEDLYNPLKGGIPQYTYTSNDDNYFSRVYNGNKINAISREYVPMMKALCEEYDIPFIIAKSPNYARWGYDDTYTKVVRDFAAEMDIPFLDFMDERNNTFEIYDYGYQTGRLNVYGVQKFSTIMGDYLTKEFGLQPTVLSEENKAAWDACVTQYYERAAANDCNLYPGQIAQINNQDGSICLRWNASDSEIYSIYRCQGKTGEFRLLTDSASGVVYNDTDVLPGQGYSYYIIPNEGSLAGTQSQIAYYVYVDMPKNFTAENINGQIHLNWDETEATSHYRLSRRVGEDFNFSFFSNAEGTYFVNKSVTDGEAYYYRLSSVYEEDGVNYVSMTTNVSMIPQHTPMLSGISTGKNSIKISWSKLTGQDEILIWRRSENEEDFILIDTISGTDTSYTDKTVEVGTSYFYQISSRAEAYGIEGHSDFSNIVGAKILE